MSATVAAVALIAGLGASLLVPARATGLGSLLDAPPARPSAAEADWMRRHRALLSLLAGLGATTFVGSRPGLVAGLVGAAVCWAAIGRAEPAGVRREREALRRDLPQVVRLLAGALASGCAPTDAVEVVAAAVPGPAADRLGAVAARLRLGVDPVTVWHALVQEPALAPLGRTLARAHVSGASVVASVERLADELTRTARADVEDRARRVGVKAAVPLGLCLLPAFVLVGIVPLVGGLLTGLAL